jgi:uncharacterized membrane protein YraQ (UPF0718 family)
VSKLKNLYLTIVLLGYGLWLALLLKSATLKLYINPRLSFLTCLTLLVLGAMLLNILYQSPAQSAGAAHKHEHNCEYICTCGQHGRLEFTSLLLLLPLLVAVLFPPRALSYQADGATLTALLPKLATVFLSIIIQALPFVLIGVFGSAAMHQLVTAEMVEAKLSRTARIPGILLAIGAGFLFPVCDCGVIPVARRLLIKKVPPYMAVAFLVTAPLTNPITIWATATAFGYNFPVTLLRVGMAILVGIVVALMVSRYFPTIEQLFNKKTLSELPTATAGPVVEQDLPSQRGSVVSAIFNHANEEFLEVGKFLIFGALLATTIQTLFFHPAWLGITQNPLLSVVIMMLLALCLSLCAEADAFVARSFLNNFPLGSIMSFMVFGQMIDLKNLALLLKNFKLQALLGIFGLCAILVLGFCSLLNLSAIDALIIGR